MAGVMPGLRLGASVMLVCVLLAYRHPTDEAVLLRDALKVALETVWGGVTSSPFILGGILVWS